MSGLLITLMITHAAACLALVLIVLLQQGKAQGLSGAIAGAGESFFGKSKARTIDAMLKKFTTVVAALFIINSIALFFVISAETPVTQDQGANVDESGMDQIINLEPEATGWAVEDGVVVDAITGESIDMGLYVDDDGFTIVDEDGMPIGGFFVADDGLVMQMPFNIEDLVF